MDEWLLLLPWKLSCFLFLSLLGVPSLADVGAEAFEEFGTLGDEGGALPTIFSLAVPLAHQFRIEFGRSLARILRSHAYDIPLVGGHPLRQKYRRNIDPRVFQRIRLRAPIIPAVPLSPEFTILSTSTNQIREVYAFSWNQRW